MGRKQKEDLGLRIVDLKARCWILAPGSSEFVGSLFLTTKAPSHQD